MGNILDYLEQNGKTMLSEKPFSEVDNLILSELAYVNMSWIMPEEAGASISLRELCKRYEESGNSFTFSVNNPEPLLKSAAASRRFGDMRLMNFCESTDVKKQLQFSAVTFELSDGTCYISFRGTDATIAGWHEDCNFSFLESTPGQLESVRYINETAKLTDGKLRVGGHSKGGNFAVYGSAFCDEKIREERITEIYNNDGPGFNDRIVSKAEYRAVLPKVIKIIPESSLVGLLLSGMEDRIIIKSSAKGIFQHDPYSWCVDGDRFERAVGLSAESAFTDQALHKWIGSLDDSQRKLIVTSLFDSIKASGAQTLDEIKQNKIESYNAMLRAAAQFPFERRAELMKLMGGLAMTSGELFFTEARKRFDRMTEETANFIRKNNENDNDRPT